jgi:hypothetical protein
VLGAIAIAFVAVRGNPKRSNQSLEYVLRLGSVAATGRKGVSGRHLKKSLSTAVGLILK